MAQWRADNRDYRADYMKAWREANAELVAEQSRRRASNRARENERVAAWVRRNYARRRERVHEAYKRRELAKIVDPVLREIRDAMIDLRAWQLKHPGQFRTNGDDFDRWFREMVRQR